VVVAGGLVVVVVPGLYVVLVVPEICVVVVPPGLVVPVLPPSDVDVVLEATACCMNGSLLLNVEKACAPSRIASSVWPACDERSPVGTIVEVLGVSLPPPKLHPATSRPTAAQRNNRTMADCTSLGFTASS